MYGIRSKRRSISFSDDKEDNASKSNSHFSNYRKKISSEVPKGIFGKQVTTVYVTLSEDLCRRHTSGTQATAAVNRCLQASQSKYSTNDIWWLTFTIILCAVQLVVVLQSLYRS